MRRLAKSRTYIRRLKSAFRESDEIAILVVRMAVLFEDLRIEYLAAKFAGDLEEIDVLPSIYRKFYFIRRSTITLVEFMGSFTYLNQRPEFKAIRAQFDDEAERDWQAASEYFVTNKQFLKDVRNDYGGHFQLSTARRVLQDIHPDAVGTVDIIFDRVANTAAPRMRFAYEIVANAFVMHKNQRETEELYARRLFETVWKGVAALRERDASAHCLLHRAPIHVVFGDFDRSSTGPGEDLI